MFEMRLSDLVGALKEQTLPRSQGNKQALYLRFDVGLSVFSPVQVSRRSLVHLLLYCPYGGSTHVFVAEEDFGSHRPLNELEWQNTSNHDSCWRTDGVDSPLSRIYFQQADEINAQLESAGEKTLAPIKMHQTCYFDVFGAPAWSLVDVKLGKENLKTWRRTVEVLTE